MAKGSFVVWQPTCWPGKCFANLLLDHIGKLIPGLEKVHEGRDLKPCFLNWKHVTWKRETQGSSYVRWAVIRSS